MIKEFHLKVINYLGAELPERVRDCIVDVLLEPFLGFGMIEIQGEMFDGNRINARTLKSFRLSSIGNKMIAIFAPIIPYDQITKSFIEF